MLKKELKIPNCASVYRIVEVGNDGEERPTGKYRVRRRLKDSLTGKWTTTVSTYDDFNEAKRASKRALSTLKVKVTCANSFKEVFERFMLHQNARELRRGTLEGLRSRAVHLKFFEPFQVSAITPKAIDGWLKMLRSQEYREKNRSSRLCYTQEYALLSAVLNYYREYEDDRFVLPLLKRHRKSADAKPRDRKTSQTRHLSEFEESIFLDAISKGGPIFHDLAFLQLNTGLRVGEAAALEVRNIDFRQSELHVRQHLDWPRRSGLPILLVPGTKTGLNRSIPLTGECLEMLRRRAAISKNGIIFADPRNEEDWVAFRQIQYAYDKALAEASPLVRGTHSLRHTFAVRFLNKVGNIHALQKILGHSSLEETQVYAKYSDESVRASFQLFKGGKADVSAGFVPPAVPNNQVINLR